MDETELAWWRDKVSRNIGPDLTRLQAAATRVPAPPQGPLARVQMEDALKRAIGKLRSPNPLSEGEKELIKQGIAELRPMLRAAAGIVDELGMHSSWLSQIYGHAWAALRDRLRDLVPAVVRIERIESNPHPGARKYQQLGSGFMLSPELLLTCAHVLNRYMDGQHRIKADEQLQGVRGNDKSFFALRAIVRWSEPEAQDLALVQVTRQQVAPLELARVEAIRDSAVAVLGYPGGGPESMHCYVSPGEIISRPRSRVKHDCHTKSGHSGSPVVGMGDGKVCGVHTGAPHCQAYENQMVSLQIVREFCAPHL